MFNSTSSKLLHLISTLIAIHEAALKAHEANNTLLLTILDNSKQRYDELWDQHEKALRDLVDAEHAIGMLQGQLTED